MRNCQYDTAISGEAMNEVYELLKTMTADQIRRAADMAEARLPLQEAALFRHQCAYALAKKAAGAPSWI